MKQIGFGFIVVSHYLIDIHSANDPMNAFMYIMNAFMYVMNGFIYIMNGFMYIIMISIAIFKRIQGYIIIISKKSYNKSDEIEKVHATLINVLRYEWTTVSVMTSHIVNTCLSGINVCFCMCRYENDYNTFDKLNTYCNISFAFFLSNHF